MGRSSDYKVTVKETARVAAAASPQEHFLPLSNLDLLLPPLDVCVFFCYKRPPPSAEMAKCSLPSFAAIVGSLKASLARALETYYPLAAEVVANPAGEPELLCNNRGVDFAVAYADVELRELWLCDPMESVEGKLVPEKKGGVLSVQVTELKCGGVVVACTFDHRTADAYSTNMFLVAWTELATSKPLSRPPSFRRSLLAPRRPLHPEEEYSFDRLYLPLSSLPPPPPPGDSVVDEVVNRIYYISAADVRRLQASTNNRTKIEAFTAYLWRVMAKAAPPEDASCRMGVVVDGRSRLGGDTGMSGYFGNVLSIPYGTLGVADLRGMELAEVAEVVHGWLRREATGEHFRGLVDWVEAHRPEPAVAKIYFREAGEGPACVISSGTQFPVAEVEFGWGKAAFGSYHFPWGGSTGYVMPMPSAASNGDWVVYVYLTKKVTEVLEAEHPPLFRLLTPDYYLP